jgi:hypothetical protein
MPLLGRCGHLLNDTPLEAVRAALLGVDEMPAEELFRHYQLAACYTNNVAERGFRVMGAAFGDLAKSRSPSLQVVIQELSAMLAVDVHSQEDKCTEGSLRTMQAAVLLMAKRLHIASKWQPNI